MTTLNTIVFKKMAARFPEISCEEIEKLAEKAVNKNTVKTTKTWMNVWKSWAESKGLNNDIVKYEAKELDECLSRFFAEIRKSDGSDYEPDSLRVMLAALDRHLKENDSKISIAKDREFVKCRQVLEGKARALREKGHGKRPNATKALTVQDEEQLWKNRVLGEQNPKQTTPLRDSFRCREKISSKTLKCYLVLSLNSPFFPPHIGAQAGRAKEESYMGREERRVQGLD